jgi:ubiquinone/menaquinone biosynthesis C-methylase UbiE
MTGYPGAVEQEIIFSFLEGGPTLEIGTGTGRFACLLKNKGYFGIDLSRNMLNKAREKASNILIIADGENLPFRGETFSNVICSRTFRFIPNPLKALSESHRVLRKGGKCIVSLDLLRDFYGYKIARMIFKAYHYETHYKTQEVFDLYKKSAFKIIFQDMPFTFPETLYKYVPRSSWKLVRWMDNRLKKRVKGWFIVVVGKKD